MSRFGKTLFSGSPFFFWALAPFLVIFAIIMPWVISVEGVFERISLYGVSLCSVLLAIGLANPKKFSWALRLLSAAVFLSYSVYLASEIIEYFGGVGSLAENRSEPSVFTALMGLLVIGYPSFTFMCVGRFTWKKEASSEIENIDDFEVEGMESSNEAIE